MGVTAHSNEILLDRHCEASLAVRISLANWQGPLSGAVILPSESYSLFVCFQSHIQISSP